MKFSEFDEAGWPGLQPYLDTCLLPVTGLHGDEAPWQMTEWAEKAGAWLSPLEQAFKGRTVTLPAFHYHDGTAEAAENLNMLCSRHRRAGFRYIVLVSGRPGLLRGINGVDLILQPESPEDKPDPELLRKAVSSLWQASDGA